MTSPCTQENKSSVSPDTPRRILIGREMTLARCIHSQRPPPDHENIHPDWIGRFSATMCSKHLGGMEGDGARALRPSRAQADPSYMTIAVQNVTQDRVHHITKPDFPMATAALRHGQPWLGRDSSTSNFWWMPIAVRWTYNGAKPTLALWGMLPLKARQPRPKHRAGSQIRWRVFRL
jgi:hypothetical protein